MWTLALHHTVLACIPLRFIDSRLGITTCTDVDMERWSEKWTEVHHFYVWHSFARWYSVTVQFNWGGSFAHSSIKTLLLMHCELWIAWTETWLHRTFYNKWHPICILTPEHIQNSCIHDTSVNLCHSVNWRSHLWTSSWSQTNACCKFKRFVIYSASSYLLR